MNQPSELKIRRRLHRKSPPSREEREAAVAQLFEKLAELSLSESLKLMRTAAGMDQASYARLTKVSRPMLAAIEAGSANPSVEILNRLAKPFGLHVGFVRGLPEE